jgi:hypothetical protein
MAKKERGQIVETPTEARQAEFGPSVLVLLVISTGACRRYPWGRLVGILPHLTVSEG